MAEEKLPSVELLRKLIKYDPETGALTWRKRTPDVMPCDTNRGRWNTRWAGKAALNSKNALGYLEGSISDRSFLAHRVAFCIHAGRPPRGCIDHINGQRDDNRLVNLREADAGINARNRRMSRKNTSGCIGVSWDKVNRKWEARIKSGYKSEFLGRFDDLESAKEARRQAEARLGFHPNHGDRVVG